MSKRREYPFPIKLNGKTFDRLVIDPHYEENHPEINDQIIHELVRTLENERLPVVKRQSGFSYVVAEPVYYSGKPHRVILTYTNDTFLGVVNAFRIKEKESW